MADEIRWQFGRYQIVTHERTGRMLFVDNESVRCDWPMFVGGEHNQKAATDYPELWPAYVKSAALVLNDLDRGVIDSDMANVRLSVCIALAFMDHTPKTDPDKGFLWWASEMPGYPETYNPEEWEAGSTGTAAPNWSLERVWDQYIGDLDGEGLHEYAEAARRLDLTALGVDLAEAEADAEGLWLRVRVYCGRTGPHKYDYTDVVIIYRPALQVALEQIEDEHGKLYTYDVEESFDNLALVGGKISDV